MKREDIENSLKEAGITDETVLKNTTEKVMGLHGKAVKEKDDKISTLETKVGTLETQAKENKDKIEELSKIDPKELQDKITELTEKYDTDTKALNEKISQTEYAYNIKNLADTLNFTSESAKKTFVSDLTKKGLKFEEGKLIGFDDFVSKYKEQDPNAFIKDEEPTPPPVVVSTGGEHTDDSKTTLSLEDALKQNYKNK